MGGTGPCDSIKITFGYHVKTSRPQFTDLIKWEVLDPVDRYSPFSIPTSVWVMEVYVQIFKSVALCVRTQLCLPQTDGRTDGQPDIAQMS